MPKFQWLQEKAEAKLAGLEAKNEQQRRARMKAEAEWRQQQRERELKRAQNDMEREKEVRCVMLRMQPFHLTMHSIDCTQLNKKVLPLQ